MIFHFARTLSSILAPNVQRIVCTRDDSEVSRLSLRDRNYDRRGEQVAMSLRNKADFDGKAGLTLRTGALRNDGT